jgi:hypothetical protein
MSNLVADLERRLEEAEDENDALELRLAKIEDAVLGGERIPSVVVDHLAKGAPQLRVWREYRDLSLRDLGGESRDQRRDAQRNRACQKGGKRPHAVGPRRRTRARPRRSCPLELISGEQKRLDRPGTGVIGCSRRLAAAQLAGFDLPGPSVWNSWAAGYNPALAVSAFRSECDIR